MSRRSRRALVTLHLAVSVGWIGAVVAYLVLGVAAEVAGDGVTIRAAWIAMEFVGWFAVTPLAIASLITGIIMAIGTPWGLLDHYWVAISLALTSIAVAILLVHMPDVTANAEFARIATGEQLQHLGGDLAHPAIGLLILIVVLVLNVYKPRGLTRRGRRRAGLT